MTTTTEPVGAHLERDRRADESGDLAAKRRKIATKKTTARWVKRALLVIVAVAIAAAIGDAFRAKPIAVDTAVVRRGALQIFVESDGKTRVRERYVVGAPLSGDLARIGLEPGDTVEAGDVIARFDPSAPQLLDVRSAAEAEARLAAALARQRQAEATAARGRAARDLAVRDAERFRSLRQSGVATEAQLDQAEFSARIAGEELAAAELQRRVAAAEIASAEAVLGRARGGRTQEITVKAPAGGRVLRVLRESAGPVVAGTPLIEIGDPSTIEVVVDVLSSDAVKIRQGAHVTLEQWGDDRPIAGRVRLIEPSAFTHISALGVEEQRVNVIIVLNEVPAGLGDSFRVEAKILTHEEPNALVAPASAVFRQGDGWAVYAVHDGRAVLQPIEVGVRGRLEVQVLKGVAEGAELIVYPGDRVRHDVRVEPRSTGA